VLTSRGGYLSGDRAKSCAGTDNKENQDAKKEALKEFQILKEQEVVTESSSPLCLFSALKALNLKSKTC